MGYACDDSLSACADEYLFSSQSVKPGSGCVSGSISVVCVCDQCEVCQPEGVSLHLCALVTSL